MFVQIIQGKLRDADLFRRQHERWRTELRPGAEGFLGSTSGTTPTGVAVVVARFDSEASARANSARPEQSAWWEQTAPAFDGDVTFHDCREVDSILDGGSDQAGFVQVIQGRAVDPAAMREAGKAMEDDLRQMRHDILGGIVAWHGDRGFSQIMYFASEDDARKGESAMQDDPRAGEWASLIDGAPSFLDLTRPEFD